METEGHFERGVPFALPDVGEAEAIAVGDTIRSGWITSGPSMRAFELEFSAFCGGEVQSVAVNSATSGLHLALEAVGVGPDDEVIVPTWTFTATAEVVRYLGARPVIVDIDRNTLNISLDAVEAALSPKTKAVIPVHMAGLPVDLIALKEVLGDRPIHIVEDAAHALPSVGTSGLIGNCDASDVAVFSFYATKTITTGEGGMITSRRPDLIDRMRVMRLHGIDRDAFDRYTSKVPSWAYDVVAPGFKYNMPDTAAAMGRVQLARAESMQARRCEIAHSYLAAFADLPLDMPVDAPTPQQQHSWHLFVIRLKADAQLTRDQFISSLADQGIGTSVHFIPLHEHSYWRPFVMNPATTLPNATWNAPRAVSLPIYSKMSDDDVQRVIAAVSHALR